MMFMCQLIAAVFYFVYIELGMIEYREWLNDLTVRVRKSNLQPKKTFMASLRPRCSDKHGHAVRRSFTKYICCSITIHCGLEVIMDVNVVFMSF